MNILCRLDMRTSTYFILNILLYKEDNVSYRIMLYRMRLLLDIICMHVPIESCNEYFFLIHFSIYLNILLLCWAASIVFFYYDTLVNNFVIKTIIKCKISFF